MILIRSLRLEVGEELSALQGKAAKALGCKAGEIRELKLVKRSLEAAHLKVYLPTSLPLNDGGISYGQAAVARARMASAILNQANEQE